MPQTNCHCPTDPKLQDNRRLLAIRETYMLLGNVMWQFELIAQFCKAEIPIIRPYTW
jgi:hypothetical protein